MSLDFHSIARLAMAVDAPMVTWESPPYTNIDQEISVTVPASGIVRKQPSPGSIRDKFTHTCVMKTVGPRQAVEHLSRTHVKPRVQDPRFDAYSFSSQGTVITETDELAIQPGVADLPCGTSCVIHCFTVHR